MAMGAAIRVHVRRGACPLCEGMQEKLAKVLEAVEYDAASPMHGARLEVVTVGDDDARAVETPFITFVKEDGEQELPLKRPSPRLSAQQLQRHVERELALACGAPHQAAL